MVQCFEAGDKNRGHQTKHDREHALQVAAVFWQLAEQACPYVSEILKWCGYIAAIAHDIGSFGPCERHAEIGARFMHKLMGDHGLPPIFSTSICKIIENHRSKAILEGGFDRLWPTALNRAYNWRAIHAIVAMADKLVGDSTRVRIEHAESIVEAWHSAAGAPMSLDDRRWHDAVNLAILESWVEVVPLTDPDGRDIHTGTITLKLKMNETLAGAEKLFELYGERYYACVKCAWEIGFAFLVEVNGITHRCVGDASQWQASPPIFLPTPSD
jgi:hypothetical protein